MQTHKIKLRSIKSEDWGELAYALKFKKFKEDHNYLNEDDLNDKFYEDVISKTFKYGDFADLEIVFNESFNIIGGRVIPKDEQ